jgi:hypothetical protein
VRQLELEAALSRATPRDARSATALHDAAALGMTRLTRSKM